MGVGVESKRAEKFGSKWIEMEVCRELRKIAMQGEVATPRHGEHAHAQRVENVGVGSKV